MTHILNPDVRIDHDIDVGVMPYYEYEGPDRMGALVVAITHSHTMKTAPNQPGVEAFARVERETLPGLSLLGAALSFAERGHEVVLSGPDADGPDSVSRHIWEDLLANRPGAVRIVAPPSERLIERLLTDESFAWTVIARIKNATGERLRVFPGIKSDTNESTAEGQSGPKRYTKSGEQLLTLLAVRPREYFVKR